MNVGQEDRKDGVEVWCVCVHCEERQNWSHEDSDRCETMLTSTAKHVIACRGQRDVSLQPGTCTEVDSVPKHAAQPQEWFTSWTGLSWRTTVVCAATEDHVWVSGPQMVREPVDVHSSYYLQRPYRIPGSMLMPGTISMSTGYTAIRGGVTVSGLPCCQRPLWGSWSYDSQGHVCGLRCLQTPRDSPRSILPLSLTVKGGGSCFGSEMGDCRLTAEKEGHAEGFCDNP